MIIVSMESYHSRFQFEQVFKIKQSWYKTNAAVPAFTLSDNNVEPSAFALVAQDVAAGEVARRALHRDEALDSGVAPLVHLTVVRLVVVLVVGVAERFLVRSQIDCAQLGSLYVHIPTVTVLPAGTQYVHCFIGRWRKFSLYLEVSSNTIKY